MASLEENEMLMKESYGAELIDNDGVKLEVMTSNKNDDEEFDDAEDDDFSEEEEAEENPFDKEPTEKDIIENDIPIIDPEDELLDDEEEIPYN